MAHASNVQDTIAKLRTISLLNALKNEDEALMFLANLVKTRSYQKSSYVLTEGEDGDALFIIKSGIVEIIKSTMQKDPYMVAKLSADQNSFFGEMALIDSDKRSASAICATECEFYIIERESFLELCTQYPIIGFAIYRELSKILCTRLRKANSDIVCLFGALVEEVVESGGLSE